MERLIFRQIPGLRSFRLLLAREVDMTFFTQLSLKTISSKEMKHLLGGTVNGNIDIPPRSVRSATSETESGS